MKTIGLPFLHTVSIHDHALDVLYALHIIVLLDRPPHSLHHQPSLHSSLHTFLDLTIGRTADNIDVLPCECDGSPVEGSGVLSDFPCILERLCVISSSSLFFYSSLCSLLRQLRLPRRHAFASDNKGLSPSRSLPLPLSSSSCQRLASPFLSRGWVCLP
ncbi:hypothetical protein BJV78DRAFT_830932 [Lactifluus subvellereus]|nr:hypothetical protein BJV78DRAFT_830932 [Lactifluus subvellereus]